MKRTRLVIVIGFVLSGSFAFAQDEKTELGVFAGGYFNSGFQSFKVLNPITGAQVGTFNPSAKRTAVFSGREVVTSSGPDGRRSHVRLQSPLAAPKILLR